jgi:predicted PP-loop superfamily ATPase
MSELNCEQTLGKVFEFLANDLDEAQKSQIKNHIFSCGTCEREYAIESKISSIISNSSVNAQTSFASKMQSRLQSEL